MYRVLEHAEKGEIDLDEILRRAKERNRQNEELLLAEWKRLLDDAQHGLVPGGGLSRMMLITGGTPEAYRLGLIDVLQERLDDAASRGVTWAQLSPGRREQLVSAVIPTSAAGNLSERCVTSRRR
jgi:hypothetical protein